MAKINSHEDRFAYIHKLQSPEAALFHFTADNPQKILKKNKRHIFFVSLLFCVFNKSEMLSKSITEYFLVFKPGGRRNYKTRSTNYLSASSY